MSDNDKGQVSASAAQVYEDFFIPALFQEWVDRVVDIAQISPGQRVLDVACGTGVLARAVGNQVGPGGSVVGLDVNEGMLAVARKNAPAIDWRQGMAESLPFAEEEFDAVVSQFGLMFFVDRQAALREMGRVLKPGGRLVVAVWDSLENVPGYAAMAGLLLRLFGDEAARALQMPYVLGDPAALQALFAEAGFPHARITPYEGTARFPSIESWVYTDIKGWTLSEMIDDGQYERLLAEAQRELQPFVAADGSVSFSSPALIASATK